MFVEKLLMLCADAMPWSLRRRVKAIPGVAQLQRRLFHRFLAGKQFIHTINAGPATGLVYPVDLPTDKLVWAGTYEPELSTVLRELVRPGDICYDVGAYRGFFSGVFAVAGAGEVFAFEPHPINVQQIERMIALNPQRLIRVVPVALGESTGEIEFNFHSELSMGKTQDSGFRPDDVVAETRLVPLRSIDSLVQGGQLPPPAVMKIDVEGAELAVLRGSLAVLQEHGPACVMELHSLELREQCIALLGSLGYSVKSLPRSAGTPAEISHIVARR